MSRAAVELDFFGMEKEGAAAGNATKSQFQKFLGRRRSFRGMQNAISKINPELLRTVIVSGSAAHAPMNPNLNQPFNSRKSFSVPSTPKADQNLVPAVPVQSPIFWPVSPETAPLTIFYNGTVSVFDVSSDQAESIMKLVSEGGSKNVENADAKVAISLNEEQQLLETLNGDLPMTRRKSLHRFLERRKERLTCASPYACDNKYAFPGANNTAEEQFFRV